MPKRYGRQREIASFAGLAFRINTKLNRTEFIKMKLTKRLNLVLREYIKKKNYFPKDIIT